MTPHTVTLLMAGDTTLQVLSSGLGVAQDPESLVVMEGGDRVPSALQSEVHMALPAEPLRSVARGTVAYPSVGFGAVGGQEIQRVKVIGVLAIMALGACVLGVARRTVGLPG